MYTDRDVFFPRVLGGEEIAVTKLNNVDATAPNNEAQDVHLNSWIYWIEKEQL